MNEKLVSILLAGKVRCPHMAALGYPRDPDALPCTCEIPNTREQYINTTQSECYANNQCLVFLAMPTAASEEESSYDQRRWA